MNCPYQPPIISKHVRVHLYSTCSVIVVHVIHVVLCVPCCGAANPSIGIPELLLKANIHVHCIHTKHVYKGVRYFGA